MIAIQANEAGIPVVRENSAGGDFVDVTPERWQDILRQGGIDLPTAIVPVESAMIEDVIRINAAAMASAALAEFHKNAVTSEVYGTEV